MEATLHLSHALRAALTLSCLLALSQACADSQLQTEGLPDAGSTTEDVGAEQDSAGTQDSGQGSDAGGAPDMSTPDMPQEDDGALPQCVPSQEVCDGLDNDCNGRVDEIACACTQENTCYLGPPQTRGVGACRDGGRACDQSGEFFQDCAGGVLPTEELCLDGIDNDCDGVVDEDPCLETCQPGESRQCYTGPQQAAGVGVCSYGMQDCNAQGTWNACRGAVQPGSEVCGDDRDNDCDGLTDVDCADNLPLIEDDYTVGESSTQQPVDFIMAMDNSGSMNDTVERVEANLGFLAQKLNQSGVDFRFVMVSERGTGRNNPDVCVPEPLAGPNCADTERFKHVDEEVSSTSAFADILQCYDDCGGESYRGFLRPGSYKQVIVVSDDDAGMTWAQFRDQMRLKAGLFTLNGVVGTIPGECTFRVGYEYLDGITETRGEALHICDLDWGIVIDVLFEATLERLDTVFQLSKSPIRDTLQVFAQEGDGPLIEQVGNWRYNELINNVTFLPNIGPPEGARVLLRYRTLDDVSP
jgi:hypothetical protein